MTRLRLLCLAAASSTCVALPTWACDITLKPDGNTAAIQHAMDRAGAVICLRPGTYPGARLVAAKSITLRRVGKERVILDAGNQGRVLTIQHDGVRVVLDGLTLTNGRAPQGGAVAVLEPAHLLLRDCHLTQNEATLHGGGAVFAKAGQVDLVRTRLTHNRAERGSAVELTGKAQARIQASLIADNITRSVTDSPVRLSGEAHLTLLQSTVAYNGGNGVLLQAGEGGRTRLRIDSSIVMGKPDAVSVHRSEAANATVARSILHGGIGYLALDLKTSRELPGFDLTEAERYRPQAGSPAIALGHCAGADALRDVAGLPRAGQCTAGALEAPPAAVRQTLRDRAAEAKQRKGATPW